MDIASHTVSGLAAASALLPLVIRKRWHAPFILLSGALGGAWPDLDAISQWGGYDSTIGKWFGLELSGRDIYFNNLWYSHHGVTHSLFGMVCFTGLFLLIMRACMPKRKRRWNWAFALPFALAYFMHLLEDMPTPGSVWEGIMLWFPFRPWVGGTGDIFWWNNYDIFLLFAGCFVVNVCIAVVGTWVPRFKRWRLTLVVFGAMLVWSSAQVQRRNFNFDYVEYNRMDYRMKHWYSLEIQRQMLGESGFERMQAFDDWFRENVHLPF